MKNFTGIDEDVLVRIDYNVVEDSENCNERQFYSCIEYNVVNPTNNPNIYVYSLYDVFQTENNVKIYNDTNKPLLFYTLNKELNFVLQYRGDLTKEKFAILTYNKSNLDSSLTKLRENMLTDIKINKNKLSAKLNSNKDGILFLTFPYDKNYEIKIDGVIKKYYPLLDNSFIGLDVSSGEHTISINYTDKRFKYYLSFSFISLVVTLLIYFYVNKYFKKKQEIEIRIKQENKEQEKNKKNKKNKKKNK